MFANTSTPAQADSGDANAIEVGTKFQANTTGYITGVRFYKAQANSGTHVGDLSSSPASCWPKQPSPMRQGRAGNRSISLSRSWSSQTPPMSSPITPRLGTTRTTHMGSSFGKEQPTTLRGSGHLGQSQWRVQLLGNTCLPELVVQWQRLLVDAVFVPRAGPPTVIAHSPMPGDSGVSTVVPVTATFSEDIQPSTLSFTLTDGSGDGVPATVTYDSSTFKTTLTPTGALNPGTTYTASVSGVKDDSGNSMLSPSIWTFSTFSCPCTLWSTSTTPSHVDSGDLNSVELGVKFRSDINGFVDGLRFFKSAANTGTHVGSLWTSTGALLAQGTFSNESASGWQQLSFTNPVPVTANATYVVSYHTTVGHYSFDSSYFVASGVDNGPLHGLTSSVRRTEWRIRVLRHTELPEQLLRTAPTIGLIRSSTRSRPPMTTATRPEAVRALLRPPEAGSMAPPSPWRPISFRRRVTRLPGGTTAPRPIPQLPPIPCRAAVRPSCSPPSGPPTQPTATATRRAGAQEPHQPRAAASTGQRSPWRPTPSPTWATPSPGGVTAP